MESKRMRFISQAVNLSARFTDKLKQYPGPIKILIAPLLFLVSFAIIFPALAIFGIVHKILIQTYSLLKFLKKGIKLLPTFFQFLSFLILISIPLISISALVFLLEAHLPLIVSAFILLMTSWIVFLLVESNKDISEEVWKLIKSDKFDVELLRNVMKEAAGKITGKTS